MPTSLSSTLSTLLTTPPNQWWTAPYAQILEEVLESDDHALIQHLWQANPDLAKHAGMYANKEMIGVLERSVFGHNAGYPHLFVKNVSSISQVYRHVSQGVVDNCSNLHHVLSASVQCPQKLHSHLLERALMGQHWAMVKEIFEHVWTHPYARDPMRAPMDASMKKAMDTHNFGWTLNFDQLRTSVQLWSSAVSAMRLTTSSEVKALLRVVEHNPLFLEMAFVYDKVGLTHARDSDAYIHLKTLFEARLDKHQMLDVVAPKPSGVGKKM